MSVIINGTTGITSPGGDVSSADNTVNGITVGKGGGSVSGNTAVGSSVLGSNTSGNYNTAVGSGASQGNTSGTNNAAFGQGTLQSNTTGSYITAIGQYAMQANSTGSNNTAIGQSSLQNNTTASNNTAVGYQAGYSNTTGTYNTFIGYKAGYSFTNAASDGNNTFVGQQAGYAVTTGYQNTFLGFGSGISMTTGNANTIVGRFGGNSGGLDIRTTSNNIVLSDGDGNPAAVRGAGINGSSFDTTRNNAWTFGNGGTSATYDGSIWLNGAASSGYGPVILGYAGGTQSWNVGSNSYIKGGTTYSTLTCTAGGNTGGVNLTSGATAWTSASDARLKNVTGKYDNALSDIAQIEPVKFTWKSDAENKPQVGVLAQSVQNVVPEAIDTMRVDKEDETDYLGVRYTELIPLMIASIQELKAEFDAYKATHP